MHQIPPEAIKALAQGRLIESIKIVRDQTGLDLKSAKEAVERYANGASGMPDSDSGAGGAGGGPAAVPSAARAALARGNKLEAVRLTREATGLGLAEAKKMVEEAPNAVASDFDSLPPRAPTNAPMGPMVEPGRVQGGGLESLSLVAVLLLLAALAWWYFGKVA